MIGRMVGIAGMLGLLAVACGGAIADESGDSDGDSGAATTATASTSASEFNRQFCDLVAGTCCPDAGPPDAGADTESACIAEYMPRYAEGMTYDPVAGAACLGALRVAHTKATFCTDFARQTDTTGAACTVVYMPAASGKAKPGEACQTELDCAPSSEGAVRCDPRSAVTGGAFCQIQRHATEGEPCDGDWQNQGGGGFGSDASSIGWCWTSEGLYCDSGTRTCTKRPGLGESCKGDAMACVDGTYCVSSTLMCATVNPIGGDCNGGLFDYGECVSNAYCDTTKKKCSASVAIGAPCTDPASCGPDNACANGTCIAGLYSTLDLCGK